MGVNTLLSLSYALSSPSGLLVADTLGDYEVSKTQAGAVSAVKSLNTILTDACVAVGAVLIAIAVVKIIIAMASEDSKGKMDSGMLFGAGIVFISISGVIKVLGIQNMTSSTSGRQMAASIISVVGRALSYVGVVVFLFAIVSLVIAIAQENSDSYVTASKMIMTSVGMLAADSLLAGIRLLTIKGDTDATNWVNAIVTQVAKIATWGALGLCTCGIFKIVMGIRTEDERDRNTGIRFLMAGIALVSIRAIFTMFGFVE